MSKTFPKTCVALDLETTDLSASRGDIIEVAAAKFKGDKIIAEFQHLTKPSSKIPAIVSAITGITDDLVEKAPPFADVKDDLIKFVGKHPIVGHNINFDLNFLAGKDVELSNPRYDTWKLATLLAPELSSHSLEVLTSYLKIKHVESHRALDDVLASKDLFIQLINRIHEVDFSILQEINRYAAKHKWALAAVFKQVLTDRRGEKDGYQGKKKNERTSIQTKAEMTKKPTGQRKVDLDEIESLFKNKEKLRKVITNYEFRPGQVALIKQLLSDFLKNGRSIINAGPGTGRYLSYLVASAYYAQSSGKQVAISVNSFAQQRRLLAQEAELSQNITPFDSSATLLEDRNKYLCRRRLEQFKNKEKLSPAQMESLVKLLLWLEVAQFGIFSEIAWSYEDHRVEERVNCNENFCQRKDCSYYRDCFYYRALREARKSDLVIFNHSSLAANQQSKEKVSADPIIFDQSQELEKQLTNFLSSRLSENIITRRLAWLDFDPGFLRLIPKKALLKKATKSKVEALIKEVASIQDKTALFFGVLGIFASQQKEALAVSGDYFTLSLDVDVRQYPEWDRVKKAGQNYIMDMYAFLAQLDKLLGSLKQKSAQEVNCDISGIYQDLYGMTKELEKIIVKPSAGEVAWLNLINNHLQLSLSPQQTGDFLRDTLLVKTKTAAFVSPIFDNKVNIDYFRKRLELGEEYNQHNIDSLYQYDKQTKIIIPTDMAGHNQPGFNQDVEKIIKAVAVKLSGKIIVAFSSKAAIKKMFVDLALPLKEKGIKVLGLGISGGEDKVKQEYLNRDQTVLLVTHEFLLRNEIPLDNLSCLLVHKLPFGFFSDPLTMARSQGSANAFQESALPEALYKWQQIFQQLIKSRDDRGAFVILDNRVESAKYGADFIKSLPTSQVEYCRKSEIDGSAHDWLNKGK